MDSQAGVPINEEALSLLIGRQISIDYTDKNGFTTTRFVTPKGFTDFHGYRAIRAFCHLRNEERSFLLMRIRRCSFSGWLAFESALKAQQRADAKRQLISTKKLMAGLICTVLLSFGGCIFSKVNMTPATVSVSGYMRRDGTRVSAYDRRPPGMVSHDRPYELLQTLCVIMIIGGCTWAWAAHDTANQLKKKIEVLSK